MAHYVVGVNIGFHDSSAALLRDGALCSLIEQERLSRRKHAVGQPPTEAIVACLAEEGIGPQERSTIAIGWDVPEHPARLTSGPQQAVHPPSACARCCSQASTI